MRQTHPDNYHPTPDFNDFNAVMFGGDVFKLAVMVDKYCTQTLLINIQLIDAQWGFK